MTIQENKLELAHVVKRFGKPLINQVGLAPQQTKVLHNIVQCRTAILGGHQETCNTCKAVSYSYNSCGDRHCPKCQHNKQVKWIEKLQEQALPVKHYHLIFTLPHCLNTICLWNDKMYYNLMFKAVWDTLRSFGYTHYGVESGAVAVLHTWGQNLSLHPHIHCIVPAGGIDLKGQWKNIGKDDKYLYPVKQLSATFRGKFLDSLKKKLTKMDALVGFREAIQKSYLTNWVVFCEAPLTGVKQVIRYLGQYTHKIAISNQRIKSMTQNDVLFYAKDYRDNATMKLVKMKGVEFLRRFIQHVLPKGFVRIRSYGVYNATVRKNLNLKVNQLSDFELLLVTHIKAEKLAITHKPKEKICPSCKKLSTFSVKLLPRIRSPAGHLPTLLRAYLN